MGNDVLAGLKEGTPIERFHSKEMFDAMKEDKVVFSEITETLNIFFAAAVLRRLLSMKQTAYPDLQLWDWIVPSAEIRGGRLFR